MGVIYLACENCGEACHEDYIAHCLNAEHRICINCYDFEENRCFFKLIDETEEWIETTGDDKDREFGVHSDDCPVCKKPFCESCGQRKS